MRSYRVIFMPSAKEGLFGIAEYIALDNPVRAMSFIAELTTSLKKTLSIFPKSGHVYDDLDLGVEIRTFPYRNYTSFYQVNEGKRTVEILFILNSKQNIVRFLEGQ